MKYLIEVILIVAFIAVSTVSSLVCAPALLLVVCITLLLFAHLWTKKRRILASIIAGFTVVLLCIRVPVLSIAALLFAGYQWDNMQDKQVQTKSELENCVFLSRTVPRPAFTNLYMSCFYTWNEDDNSWKDLNGRVYIPTEGDTFISYKILGFLPIDAIYDRHDNLKLAFNSFDL